MTIVQSIPEVRSVNCDKPSCKNRLLPDLPEMRVWDEEFRDLIVRNNWTFWTSRTQRQYCPDHRPVEGKTKMRLVLGS